MMRIGVITATRAEYGLLRPVIEELRKYESDEIRIDLIVTGTHLSQDYGMTVSEIESDGLRIDHRIPIPTASSSPRDISDDQAKTLIAFTDHFSDVSYDAVMILGDRYEMLMVAVAAMNTQTPIIHLCGGDTTEGAIDEAVRHSITKMSYLHFPTDDESRRRIIQMGEAPDRVYNAGNTSIDNMVRMDLMDKDAALKSIDADKWQKTGDCALERAAGPSDDSVADTIDYALCTYHPVTLEGADVDGMMAEFLGVIELRPDIQFIVTKSNADMGGSRINEILDEAEERIANLHVYPSLGVLRYLSLMKHARLVMGNSSSGLYEAPALHVPTVNIGDRQKGRPRCASVIDCPPDKESILKAVEKALSADFAGVCQTVESPFGDGHAAEKIAKISIDTVKNGIDLKKRFYDLDKYRTERL